MPSSDFLNSDCIRDVEVRETPKREKSGAVQVVPVILRSWPRQDTPISDFQAAAMAIIDPR